MNVNIYYDTITDQSVKMNGTIKKISLTAGHLDNALEDYEDLNTDVIVQFDNGDQYIATFFSFKNLEGMLEAHKHSEEYLSEDYYKVLDAVLINDFKDRKLLRVIEHMMVEGDFQVVFKKI